MEYAGFWRCAAARGIDGAIFGLVQMVLMIGVIVTDVDGNRLSFGRAPARYFGKFVSSIVLMIGYLMAAFTQRKQALHDIMADCLVIRKPKAAYQRNQDYG